MGKIIKSRLLALYYFLLHPDINMNKFLIKLIGLGLMFLGIYFLGKNIMFTTNLYPYWWRGISADASILFLTGGIFSLFMLRKRKYKKIGWYLIIAGVIAVFISSRAVLSPTTLWQFFLALVTFSFGYQGFTTGKIDIEI